MKTMNHQQVIFSGGDVPVPAYAGTGTSPPEKYLVGSSISTQSASGDKEAGVTVS
jgi:hypothetical protein